MLKNVPIGILWVPNGKSPVLRLQFRVPYLRMIHSHNFLMPIIKADKTPVLIKKITSTMSITGRKSAGDNR